MGKHTLIKGTLSGFVFGLVLAAGVGIAAAAGGDGTGGGTGNGTGGGNRDGTGGGKNKVGRQIVVGEKKQKIEVVEPEAEPAGTTEALPETPPEAVEATPEVEIAPAPKKEKAVAIKQVVTVKKVAKKKVFVIEAPNEVDGFDEGASYEYDGGGYGGCD